MVNKVMYTSKKIFRYTSEVKENYSMCSEEKRELCTDRKLLLEVLSFASFNFSSLDCGGACCHFSHHCLLSGWASH